MGHPLLLGLVSCLVTYKERDTFVPGIFAIVLYVPAYRTIFGWDEMKWLCINSALGILGTYTEMGWLLSRAGMRIESYPLSAHLIPFSFYILYTFTLRQLILDVFDARENEGRRQLAGYVYIAFSVALAAAAYFGRGR